MSASGKGGQPRKRSGKPPGKGSGKPDAKAKATGVRGPQGPARPGPTQPGRSTGAPGTARARFEAASAGLLTTLHRLPRWIMVVAPGLFLFGGLVMVGPWAPLGSLLLLLVAAFLAWLLALAWPRLGDGSKMLRLIIIVAIIGLAFFKAVGKF